MKASDLEGMTNKELRVLAAAQGVARAGKLTKSELIAALATSPAPSGKGSAKAGANAKPTAAKTAARAPARRRKQATFTSLARPDLAAPSSRILAPAAPPPAAPAMAQAPDPGLPVPSHYGQDRLVLMVQDPLHIFAYWELDPHSLAKTQAAAGPGSTPVLIVQTSKGEEFREVDLRGGNYYLSVAPASSYEAELALRDITGKLHALARSNKVTTPAPTISSRIDEQWMGVDETFHELLELAGLPGHLRIGASAARLADRTQVAWSWQQNQAPSLSSATLSSHSLSSRSLTRP